MCHHPLREGRERAREGGLGVSWGGGGGGGVCRHPLREGRGQAGGEECVVTH